MASTLVTMQQLLEAGAHFGHQTHRWNPKMKPYIFGDPERGALIDFRKAFRCPRALDFVQLPSRDGGKVLFLGTKRHAQDSIADAAPARGHHSSPRWPRRMMTTGDHFQSSSA